MAWTPPHLKPWSRKRSRAVSSSFSLTLGLGMPISLKLRFAGGLVQCNVLAAGRNGLQLDVVTDIADLQLARLCHIGRRDRDDLRLARLQHRREADDGMLIGADHGVYRGHDMAAIGTVDPISLRGGIVTQHGGMRRRGVKRRGI